MFGIAWGIISITLMIAAGEGLRVGQQRQQETFAKDLMVFFNGRTSLQAGGLRAGREVNWQAGDIAPVQEEAPACRYVMPELERDSLKVRSLYNNASPMVTGSYPPFAVPTSGNSFSPAARQLARRSSSTTFLTPSSASWRPRIRTVATTAGM